MNLAPHRWMRRASEAAPHNKTKTRAYMSYCLLGITGLLILINRKRRAPHTQQSRCYVVGLAKAKDLLVQLDGLSKVFVIFRVLNNPLVVFKEPRRIGVYVLTDRNPPKTDEHLLPLFRE